MEILSQVLDTFIGKPPVVVAPSEVLLYITTGLQTLEFHYIIKYQISGNPTNAPKGELKVLCKWKAINSGDLRNYC